jgi:type IV secretory pathway VirB10-like protein
MNGRPPTAPAIPPSVQQARRHHPHSRRAWTGLCSTRIVGALLALGVVAIVVAKFALNTQSKTPTPKLTESTMDPTWGRQTFQYKAEEPVLPPEPKPPVDTISPELAAIKRGMAALQQELEALKQRKTTTTIINQGEKGGTRTATIPRSAPAPLLFVSHNISKDAPPPASAIPTYVLAPGATKLLCVIETVMNSDVEGYFTAKVIENVYDTATGHHLLVPQMSTILGHDQSSQLLYGNERMDTISLSLTLPDGRVVDLGRAPVTDQAGVAGLTGEVNNHYGRLVGAVFIGGALKGGMQAMQTSVMQAAGAGQVASGIAAVGNQATHRVTGPMLNTRPTIEVEAGQLCQVLLLTPLHLPAMWQGGGPRATTTARTPATAGR